MKCHFCQNELEKDTTQPRHSSPHYEDWKSCDHCTTTSGLHMVLTNSEFVHVYMDKQEFGRIHSDSNIPGASFSYPKNEVFVIRLNLLTNSTDIYTYFYEPKPLMHLPGFPINPSNAREKLKLYLLFS